MGRRGTFLCIFFTFWSSRWLAPPPTEGPGYTTATCLLFMNRLTQSWLSFKFCLYQLLYRIAALVLVVFSMKNCNITCILMVALLRFTTPYSMLQAQTQQDVLLNTQSATKMSLLTLNHTPTTKPKQINKKENKRKQSKTNKQTKRSYRETIRISHNEPWIGGQYIQGACMKFTLLHNTAQQTWRFWKMAPNQDELRDMCKRSTMYTAILNCDTMCKQRLRQTISVYNTRQGPKIHRITWQHM